MAYWTLWNIVDFIEEQNGGYSDRNVYFTSVVLNHRKWRLKFLGKNIGILQNKNGVKHGCSRIHKEKFPETSTLDKPIYKGVQNLKNWIEYFILKILEVGKYNDFSKEFFALSNHPHKFL